MDGLEAMEININDLERTNRIDAEFYQKETFKIIDKIKSLENRPITEYITVSDGNHMAISDNFQDVGVPYYRGQDIHDFFIENANPICIDYKSFNLPYMKRSHLKYGDVLLSIVGTIGEVSMVSSNSNATCNCKLAILRPNGKVEPELIAIFLKSKYGKNQIQKFKRGAVQMGLLLEDVDQLIIPAFSKNFEERIVKTVKNAKNLINMSQELYSKAEELLIIELGMKEYEESKEKTAIKSFAESFVVSGRLDAEYYQKKYDDLFALLSIITTKKLKDIVTVTKSVEPGSDFYREEGTPFVRVSNLNKYGITKPDIYLNEKDFPKGFLPKPKKDTILLSKDGSVGIAYKVTEDENFVTSAAILHLIVKNSVLPDYLTLVLNSKITSLQAEKDSGGSIIKHWKQSEIEQVVVPILSMELQRKLVDRVQESFFKREQSKALLEKAKIAVEMAIEQGEEKSIDYLTKE